MTTNRYRNYNGDISKTLAKVHPTLGINKQARETLNNVFIDFTKRIAHIANEIRIIAKIKTISSREIQGACRMLLPGELAKHAVKKGTDSVTRYSAEYDMKKSSGDGKVRRKTELAGLIWTPPRVHRLLKREIGANARLGTTAAIYLAGVMEYLAGEILSMAGNACKDLKVVRITPRHIMLAIRGDEQFDYMFKANYVIGGGVVPRLRVKK